MSATGAGGCSRTPTSTGPRMSSRSTASQPTWSSTRWPCTTSARNWTPMTKTDMNINVEYLTRVEGHGNVVVNLKEGKLETCHFKVVESPRLFEGMLRGRTIFEAQHITSRICGICSCGHTLASLQAAEDALGITPSAQTTK